MGIDMKKILVAVTALTAVSAVPAFAQTTDIETQVPSLASALEGLSDAELSEVEAEVDSGAIDGDVDVAITDAVSEAVSEGLITSEEAVDATAALEIVASNAEFFDFDILEAIGEILDSGEVSIDEIRDTLEGFNSLSDAGKAIVGQQNFELTDSTYADQNSLFNQLSDTDKAIVINEMSVVDDRNN